MWTWGKCRHLCLVQLRDKPGEICVLRWGFHMFHFFPTKVLSDTALHLLHYTSTTQSFFQTLTGLTQIQFHLCWTNGLRWNTVEQRVPRINSALIYITVNYEKMNPLSAFPRQIFPPPIWLRAFGQWYRAFFCKISICCSHSNKKWAACQPPSGQQDVHKKWSLFGKMQSLKSLEKETPSWCRNATKHKNR